MHRAMSYQMSIEKVEDDMITQQEDILQSTEDTLEKMRDVLEQMKEQEELMVEQERMIADRDEYIDHLTSGHRYVEMLVAILFSYIYGAWFGVYMCSK